MLLFFNKSHSLLALRFHRFHPNKLLDPMSRSLAVSFQVVWVTTQSNSTENLPLYFGGCYTLYGLFLPLYQLFADASLSCASHFLSEKAVQKLSGKYQDSKGH